MATKDLTIQERELIDAALKFIVSLTIKNPSMVRRYETKETANAAEHYLYTIADGDNISFSYFTYTEEDYLKIGIYNEELRALLVDNNELTPEVMRKPLLQNKINTMKTEYIEYNDYYRALAGMPPLEATPDEYFYVELKHPVTHELYKKPVHLVTSDEFNLIDIDGQYEAILKANPTILYLTYVDPKYKIPIYTSRTTKDFYIMNYNHACLSEEDTKKMIDIYYEVLIYTMSVLYSNAFTNNEYYDSYIIVYMLMATLQKFFASNIQSKIRRDVYDIESLRNIFLSYGLPFYENIPAKYLQKIVKNLNTLLSYKGTDQVFVDIANIFNLKDTQLYKYYLVKDYIRNQAGEPESLDMSNPDNLELKFAQVSTKTNDISSFLKSDFLYQTYEEVVEGDPYWGENDGGTIDEELIEEIKEYDFNYVATKYLSATTIFSMTQSVYETVYFFNTLNTMYHKNLLKDLNFYNSKIKNTGSPINLFTAVTAIYILLFRRFGYKDMLPSKLTSIASVYGYNFDGELEVLKQVMKDHSTIDMEGTKIKYWVTKELEKLTKVLSLPNNPTKADIVNDFFENKKFRDAIFKAMDETKDYRVYRALTSLQKYTCYRQAIKDLYGINTSNEYNINTFESLSEWLKYKDKAVYNWVNKESLTTTAMGETSINKEGTVKAIDELLETLDIYFGSNKFYSLFTNTNITLDLIRKYFLQMISIFKAYTVELKKVNIYYLFDDKYLNKIRIYSVIKKIVKICKADSIDYDFVDDMLRKLTITYSEKDLKKLHDYVYRLITKVLKDKIPIKKDELSFILSSMEIADSIDRYTYDELSLSYHVNKKELIHLTDTAFKIYTKYFNDSMSTLDKKSTSRRSIYASNLDIVDDKHYSSSTNKLQFDSLTNKFNNINNETLSISYTYR